MAKRSVSATDWETPTDRPVPLDQGVIINENGRKVATGSYATSKDHLTLLRWATGYGDERIWAIETAAI